MNKIYKSNNCNLEDLPQHPCIDSIKIMKVLIYIILLSTSLQAKQTLHNKDIKLINSKISNYRQYLQNDNYPKAFEILQQLQSNYPKLEYLKGWWANYYATLGKSFQQKNDFYKSVIHFQKAFKYEPNERNLSLLANAYMENRQFFDATNLLESNPQYVSEKNKIKYKKHIALGYEKMENFEGAIYQTKQLINMEPKNPAHWSKLTQFYLKNNQASEALETLERLSRLRPLNGSEKQMKRQAAQKEKVSTKVNTAISSSFEVQIDKEKYRKYLPMILNYLDEAYIELGRIFDFYPRKKTRVNILTDQNYAHVSGSKSSIGMRTLNSDEIYIRLNKSNNFDQPSKLRNTIWHEYNHHLVVLKTQNLGEIPRWFMEGIAMYLEPEELSVKDHKIIKSLAKGKALFTGKTLPVHMSGYQMYLMARSMVEYLDNQGYLNEIVLNLDHLTFSYSFSELFQEITGMDQLKFTDEWNEKLSHTLLSE